MTSLNICLSLSSSLELISWLSDIGICSAGYAAPWCADVRVAWGILWWGGTDRKGTPGGKTYTSLQEHRKPHFSFESSLHPSKVPYFSWMGRFMQCWNFSFIWGPGGSSSQLSSWPQRCQDGFWRMTISKSRYIGFTGSSIFWQKI